MTESERDRPFADDRDFWAGLADLDRDLTEGGGARGDLDAASPLLSAPPLASQPPLAARTATSAAFPGPFVPRAQPGGRPLLDIFPDDHLLSAPPSSPRQEPAAAPPAAAGEPSYGNFYGLYEPPFDGVSDLKFHYHGVEHDRVTQQMLGAIGRRDTMVLLTGGVGVGKTILCRALAEQLDRRTLVSFVPEPPRSTDALLKTLLVDFGVISERDLAGGRLASATTEELVAALREFLLSLLVLQAFAVVMLDDAQKLPQEMFGEIRKLTELGGDQSLLQVVMVGRPELMGAVARSTLRPFAERALKCKLGPLTEEEMGAYVMHRVRVAGERPRVNFEEEALRAIYSLSGGIPQMVNLLCDHALQAGASKSASVIDQAVVYRAAEALDLALPKDSKRESVLTAAVLVLAVLAGALLSALIYRADLAALIHH